MVQQAKRDARAAMLNHDEVYNEIDPTKEVTMDDLEPLWVRKGHSTKEERLATGL